MSLTVESPRRGRSEESPLYVRPWTRVRMWEETFAGPQLAEQLAHVDASRLSDAECVVFARAVQRQQAWTESLLVAVTARFAAARPEGEPALCPPEAPPAAGVETKIALGGDQAPLAASFTPAAWGAALGISTGAARRRMAEALDLVHRLPGVLQALEFGWCDPARARMVAACTRDLSADTAGTVENEVLGILPTLTLRQLQQVIAEVAATTEPDVLAGRARAVRTRREVWIETTNDDHADVFATLDTADAQRLDSRLDYLARLLGTAQRHQLTGYRPSDTADGAGGAAGQGPGAGAGAETWQQRRARALGLLADPTHVAALIHATRSLSPAAEREEGVGADSGSAADTDLGAEEAFGNTGLRPTMVYLHVRADGSCDVEGHGTICIPTVRELVGSSAVTVRPVIDLNSDSHSVGYHPSKAVTEAVTLTHPRCVFPYCDRRSRDCQLDHTAPWPTGPTTSSNLGPLCVHHHQIKTAGHWQLRRITTAVFGWRSPIGDAYTVTPTGTTRL